MNDELGVINPSRDLSGHLPADIAKPLQQAVHQIECEAVKRGLRVPDALMWFGRSA